MKKNLSNKPDYCVIPQPQSFIVTSSEPVFELTANVSLCNECGVEGIFDFFYDFLVRAFDITPRSFDAETVLLKQDDSIESGEGYSLTVSDNLVEIRAHAASGFFYGLQTLAQLLLCGEKKLCAMEIHDSPRFGERGFMLDVSRYFFSVESVKLFIDVMALNKLNRLHLHLTDDQGWRVEINRYPLLTQIGSHRSHTNFGNVAHGGYYTQQQIREIVSYAHSRYIHVVPEIDLPGHTVSAIASYPQLSCFGRELEVATHSGVKHDILCAGKSFTYEFVFNVLDEIASLFPDGEIHIGGDEAVKMRWQLCDDCQKMIKEKSLCDEEGLQAYFIEQIRKHFEGRNIKLIMWSDAGKGAAYSKDIAWQYWNSAFSEKQLSDEINSGRRIVNSYSGAYYLDLPYGNISLESCYTYEPLLRGIDKERQDCLYAVEAELWTEYVPDIKKAGYCAFPRLSAVSESSWTEPQNKSYELFLKKLRYNKLLLELYGMPYASLKQANPSFIRKYGYLLWWQRRQLHWQGLHNLIDDRKVSKTAKSKKLNK